MQNKFPKLLIGLFALALTSAAHAQKVKVGYDKGTDFSKYKTYTWIPPAMPPVRPTLYAIVVADVDDQLKAKGLQQVDKNGDLTLASAGGIEFGINAGAGVPILSTYSGQTPANDATLWTGNSGLADMNAPVPVGTLELQFVDRSANKVVWTGTVSDKLDIERKEQSVERINKGIAKLLKAFPPKK